ncbi:hypothetical protein H1O16_gp201 [Burkholderia phage BcepSaruman]|uniref:Lipoprotein n=1 Tax=Burkholderia phage BcepSaruman TaxID=2530032 RepID=A0A4D5ZCC4_9CAUD|nr:hypothetical protein H1O16_gp201 [Burkholderia phage BcepSaruman]QBX06614.1 hypothetical protein BcepSaruman_201 [Burkholderia phage BcepSaruman]
MKKYIALAVVAFTLAGCGPEPDTPLGGVQYTEGRFQVARVGVFRDELAYGDKRGIYTFVDTKTGKEYVGVSGIGIAETGSHSSGKTQTQDER